MNIADELEKLQKLREAGTLSEEEFLKAKDALLNPPKPSPGFNLNLSGSPDQQQKQWAMLLHISQLAGFLAPAAGFIVPIVIWQLKKEEFPSLDVHGKIVANWLISFIIYISISAALTLVVVGVFLLPVIGIVGLAFPIIGAVKANNGEVWEYPGSIKFIQ